MVLLLMKSRTISLLWVLSLALICCLPGQSHAATINSIAAGSAVLTPSGGCPTGDVTCVVGYQSDDTKLGVNFKDSEGIWLSMGAGSLAKEVFSFSLLNSTSETINNLRFQFVKPQDTTLLNPPKMFWWWSSVNDYVLDLEVDLGNIEISETSHSISVNLPFTDGGGWRADRTLYMNLEWDYFNNPAVDWLLNIDPGALDENLQSSAVVATPIPGALLLFGSALLGLLVGPRRRS